MIEIKRKTYYVDILYIILFPFILHLLFSKYGFNPTDDGMDLSIYKRISSVNNNEDLSNLIIELRDRFGRIPKELNNLFNLIEIKILCIEYNIEQFEFSRKGIVIGFYKNNPRNPQKLLDLSINRHSQFTLRPDQKIFYDFMGQLNSNRFELSKQILGKIK